MTQTTPNPITGSETVLVRSTATGFEQGIAAMAGLFTAGPLGSLAAWGAIRGLQGKWAPWFVLGIPASVALNVVQLFILASIVGVSGEPEPGNDYEIHHTPDRYEEIIEA